MNNIKNFDKRGYTQAVKNHNNYKIAYDNVHQAMMDLGMTRQKASGLLRDKGNLFKRAVMGVYDVNIKGEMPDNVDKFKFVTQIMNIDLTRLQDTCDIYNKFVAFDTEPTQEQFTQYYTDEEMRTQADLFKAVEMFNELFQKGYIASPVAISRAFQGSIAIDPFNVEQPFKVK